MLVTVAAAVVAAIVLIPHANAQQSDAVCEKSFDWANNTQGDSPCAVGSALLAVCSDTHTWVVPKLAPKNTYRGPSAAEANACQCSTVTYSLLAACSLCQSSNPISFTKWSENCGKSDITVGDFPFTNSTREIPLWARGPLTDKQQFDLKGARRIAGADGSSSDAWPVRDIVLVSFGIAAAFFLIFLAVYFYVRRHRVRQWFGKKGKGKYAPLDPNHTFNVKHGRVRPAAPGVYALDLDARRKPAEDGEIQYFPNQSSSYNSNTQRSYNTDTQRSNNSGRSGGGGAGGGGGGGGTYDDPFSQRFQAQHHRNASNSNVNANDNAATFGDSKPYAGAAAGASTSSLATSASASSGARPAVEYSDNLLKHPEARSTVNLIPARPAPPPSPSAVPGSGTPPPRPRRDDTTVYNFSSLASPLSPPTAPYRQQLPTSPPATQTGFGHHPAHERNASGHGSASSLSLARPVYLQHAKTPSGSSLRGGYEQGPSAPLFSRTKQVANRRKDTAFDIDGDRRSSASGSSTSSYSLVSPPTPSSSGGAMGLMSPPAEGGLNRLRAGHLDSLPNHNHHNHQHPQHPHQQFAQSSSDGATLVQEVSVPRVQVTAPSTASVSGTLVSHHGRIENASHYGQIDDASAEAYQHYPGPPARGASSPRWEEVPAGAGGLKAQPGDERDPFATLRSLSMAASEPDLRYDHDSNSSSGRATPRHAARDVFSDDPRR